MVFLVFIDGTNSEFRINFASKAQLISMLRELMNQRIPCSVGGHGLGAAEEIELLISDGVLEGTYVEISWTSPSNWLLREKVQGAAVWDEVTEPSVFSNTSFDLKTLSI